MATVTLRPNGAGGHTGLTATPATNNYTRVDEAVVDDTDFVSRSIVTYDYDLYALEDHSIPAGSTVNSVTLYYRYKVGDGGGTACEKPAIYENSTLTYGTEACGNSTSWVNGSWAKTTKPSDSGAWSLTDINDLQVGIGLHGDSDYAVAYCSQIYVVVDYTEGGSEETAAYSALPITVTVPAVTASSVELRSAEYTALSVVVTVPSVTATSVEEREASYDPISIKLEVPSMTGTSVEERIAAFSALSVLAVVPSVTGTYLAELESTFDPVSMTVTIPSMTASREEVATAAISPLSILATVPDQTASTENDAAASYTSLIISMIPPAMTASYIAELAATYDPLSMKVTPIDSTPVVVGSRTGIKFGTKISYYVEGQLVEDIG